VVVGKIICEAGIASDGERLLMTRYVGCRE
jgi:hypothetical protein